jgi:hypothetical protein
MVLDLMIQFRFEKGKRLKAGEADDSVDAKWVTFREDRVCRGRCPVTHFLGLAFADEVFTSLRDPSQLQYLHMDKHKKSMPFRIRDSKKDLLVFRNTTPDGSISQDRALPYNKFAFELAQLGFRVGFKDILRSYNLRRGTANALEGKIISLSF